MNATDFIAAIKTMVGLRPDMIERLVTIAPSLSDEDRKTTLTQLAMSHEKIKKYSTAITEDLDAGIAAMDTTIRTLKHEEHEYEEGQEHASAEKLFDDTPSTDNTNPPFFS